jgi:hypothetical protein
MMLLRPGAAEAAGRSLTVVVAVEEEDNLDTIRIIEVKEVVLGIFRDRNSAEILVTLIKGTMRADTERGMAMAGIKVTTSRTTTATLVVEEGIMVVVVGSGLSKGRKTRRKVRRRRSLVATLLRFSPKGHHQREPKPQFR